MNICSSFDPFSIESWVIFKIYSHKSVTFCEQIDNWLAWISHDQWRISANFLDTWLIGLICLMPLTRNLYQQIFCILWHILASDCRSANGVFPDDFAEKNVAPLCVSLVSISNCWTLGTSLYQDSCFYTIPPSRYQRIQINSYLPILIQTCSDMSIDDRQMLHCTKTVGELGDVELGSHFLSI